MRKLFLFLCAALMSVGSMMADTTVTWGATEFSSFGVDYLHDSRTVKGITVTVHAATNNFINVTEYGTLFNATIDNAFTFSTELGNITKIECTTIYTTGSLGDGWTIGANSATWEGNTNTLNFGNAGSMLVVSNIIFTIGDAEPEPEPAGDEITVTWNDPSGYGFEFTQDGVTLTCGEISSIDFYGPGTFTTDLGNFTKIEVTAYSSSINGDGWSGSTWTGNAASVSFSNDIYALTSIVFTIEPASTPEPEPAGDWQLVELSALAEWQNDFTNIFTVASCPGFVAITQAQAQAQTVSATGTAYVIYEFEGETGNCSLARYTDGVYVEDSPMSNVSLGTLYMLMNNLHQKYYYAAAAGGSTPEPEPEPQPATTYTVTFTASNNNVKVVENITLPHTFSCDYTNGNGELDLIIQELYNETGGRCATSGWPWGANIDQVTVDHDGNNHFVTINAPFEGTTYARGYYDGINNGNFWYSLTISIAAAGGSEPEPQDQPITGGQDPQNTTYYYSTFFDSQVSYALPTGVEAYVATISGNELTLTKIAVAGQTIPANNAVIFRANAENFTLTVSDATPVTFSATNSLQGTDEAIATPADCYVLSNEEGIGFYEYTGSLLNAHKAYIIYQAQNNAPRRMRFIFAEEQTATALDNAAADNMSVKVIENGQLVIIRNGVRYNAAGQVIE